MYLSDDVLNFLPQQKSCGKAQFCAQLQLAADGLSIVKQHEAGVSIPAVERTAMDFFLPSPTGHGMELTRQELQERLDTLSPSVFFSSDLCARYFTYMSHQNGAHFVLFDDAVSIRHKLSVAQQLGLKTALMAFPQVADLLPEILA